MIHLVLLSGGSGTRLWPLSNSTRSKQFLKVLRDANGNHVSMVQRVFGQIGSVDADIDKPSPPARARRSPYAHEDQLGEIGLDGLIEPYDAVVVGLVGIAVDGHDDDGVALAGAPLERKVRAGEHDRRGGVAALGLEHQRVVALNLAA